jgi:hypothetical protein
VNKPKVIVKTEKGVDVYYIEKAAFDKLKKDYQRLILKHRSLLNDMNLVDLKLHTKGHA